MVASTLPLVSVLMLGASAFRVKPKKRNQAQSQGQPAIGGIFAYAAPGTAQPGLQNPRGGPCFPGFRSAAVKQQWFGQEADTATTITGLIGFRHPMMDFKLLDLKDAAKSQKYRCGNDVVNRPRGLSKFALHKKEGYLEASKDLDLGWGHLPFSMANMGNILSYDQSSASAKTAGAALGWALIGTAKDAGGNGGYVGEQISHLYQNSSSKQCILTFQGSSSIDDWKANLNIQKKPFCGYAKANSFIAAEDDTSVLGAGESLVHKGFADALMQIVKNSQWQSNVRSKLSRCSTVYVTGHSLGAAQAELFGACINMAPQPGQQGYDEYKYMSYTR